jgi:hypothetical protein
LESPISKTASLQLEKCAQFRLELTPDSRVSLRRNEPPAYSLPNPTLNSLCSLWWKSPRNSRIAIVSPSHSCPLCLCERQTEPFATA